MGLYQWNSFWRMSMLPKMTKLLKTQEGFKSKAYKDVYGNWTIGYGTNLESGISTYEAEAMMFARIRAIEDKLENVIIGWYHLDPIRRDVLVNMAYNMGIEGLLGFTDLRYCIANQDMTGAAEAMLDSHWARVDVGPRATYLADIMRGDRG